MGFEARLDHYIVKLTGQPPPSHLWSTSRRCRLDLEPGYLILAELVMYLEILKDEPVKNTLYEFNLRSNMQVLRIRSKFWGKSMEFQPEGEVGAKYFIYKIFRSTNTFTFSYLSANALLQRN